MHSELINKAVSRWNDPNTRPLFKGNLIDDNNCMCAQGDVLHNECGWSFDRLRDVKQIEADRAVADALNISTAHSILLRQINDSADGAPSIVLTEPEKVLGLEASRVLKFWVHLDRLSTEDWQKIVAARDAAGAAARAAAGAAAWAAAWASNEIQGHTRLDKLFFLPFFGINSIAELDGLEV